MSIYYLLNKKKIHDHVARGSRKRFQQTSSLFSFVLPPWVLPYTLFRPSLNTISKVNSLHQRPSSDAGARLSINVAFNLTMESVSYSLEILVTEGEGQCEALVVNLMPILNS